MATLKMDNQKWELLHGKSGRFRNLPYLVVVGKHVKINHLWQEWGILKIAKGGNQTNSITAKLLRTGGCKLVAFKC